MKEKRPPLVKAMVEIAGETMSEPSFADVEAMFHTKATWASFPFASAGERSDARSSRGDTGKLIRVLNAWW